MNYTVTIKISGSCDKYDIDDYLERITCFDEDKESAGIDSLEWTIKEDK